VTHYSFEWDDWKARLNEEKHGVSFAEARSCFEDVFAVQTYDRSHSADEDRFVLMGTSEKNRIVVVAFTVRGRDTIRMISARVALRKERTRYEEQSHR
jgi:uncharacterized DUF497 family protein